MNSVSRQAIHVAVTVVVIISCMIAVVLWATTDKPPSFALELIVFLTGTVGGVANNYRRLQRIPLGIIENPQAISGQLITIQIYVSPIVGGIFAIILYIIFMSGILQGTFFPVFSSDLQLDFESYDLFAKYANPATNQDVAKALLWAFIAGFSEGFVPNFIDKVARESPSTPSSVG